MVAWRPGGPGIEPKWTRNNKVALGTAYSTSSGVWYTVDYGSLTEVYYPTIDSPQIRDLQFLVTRHALPVRLAQGVCDLNSTLAEMFRRILPHTLELLGRLGEQLLWAAGAERR